MAVRASPSTATSLLRMGLTIRDARARDAVGDRSACSASSAIETDAAAVAPRLERLVIVGDRVVVAELDDEVVGLAHLHASPTIEHERPAAKIGALVVDESHRGEGIGRALVEADGGGSACAALCPPLPDDGGSVARTRTSSTAGSGSRRRGSASRSFWTDAEPVVHPLVARCADALVDPLCTRVVQVPSASPARRRRAGGTPRRTRSMSRSATPVPRAGGIDEEVVHDPDRAAISVSQLQ